ncbi:MAG: diaminopimelate epimerase [Bacteroidetes bacterium]|nr:diaminopimelate epimerase [Bacteroidota bacterium]
MNTSRPHELKFWKYHGAGNDFIMVDNRQDALDFGPELVRFLCDRHFGIGADGLIRIENAEGCDFRMIYHNSDGLEGSMCGNGGRSAAAFALENGIAPAHSRFLAFDGMHEAWVEKKDNGLFHVRLSMADVAAYQEHGDDLIINTGSPHYIKKVAHVDAVDVNNEGRRIRYDKQISRDGVNVNFVQFEGASLKVRTYERGVECETLACGTGVTASAIANCIWNGITSSHIRTLGGELKVSLLKDGELFRDIYLEGPVQKVFSGSICIY